MYTGPHWMVVDLYVSIFHKIKFLRHGNKVKISARMYELINSRIYFMSSFETTPLHSECITEKATKGTQKEYFCLKQTDCCKSKTKQNMERRL